MLLAIDTSGATSVALLDGDRVVAEAGSDDPRGHAEAMGPLLEQVLAPHRREVDAVAFGVGPGPFTGLRVGIAAARAVALALDVPELPVLSHDAVAFAALQDGARPPIAVVADAKRRERFVTVYRGLDAAGAPARDGEPVVGHVDPPADAVVVDRPVRAVALGRVALLRRAAGVAAEPPAARYLRSPDVTPAAARKSVLG